MKFEDLVPPVELCKQIPEGKFADIALVWWQSGCNPWYLILQEWKTSYDNNKYIPAPTLHEILEDTDMLNMTKIGRNLRCAITMKINPEDFSEYILDDSPVVSAMKMWLKLYSPNKAECEREE